MERPIDQALVNPIRISSRSKVAQAYLFDNPDQSLPSSNNQRIRELWTPEKEKLMLAELLLNPNQLNPLRERDLVTLGLIKPRVNQSRLLTAVFGRPITDDEGEQYLLDDINSRGLTVVLTMPWIMSDNDVEEFYPKDLQEKLRGRAHPKYPGFSIWDKYKGYMQGGPVTAMLLYSSEGNAIRTWRDLMGGTYPEQEREENPNTQTIRGRFADNVDANIVHGTDDVPTSFPNETGWWYSKVKEVQALLAA